MNTTRLSPFPFISLIFQLFLLALPMTGYAANAPNDWSRFRFSGNQTFTSDQLIGALIAEPDFLLANHPNSNNADVHEVTKRLLIAGYKDAGFPTPGIKIETAEDGTTKITIDEGTRTYCHSVLVEGTTQIDPDELIKSFTEPRVHPDAFPVTSTHDGRTTTRWIDAQGSNVIPESPIWQQGKPAGPTTPEKLRVAIKTVLERLGYAHAEFKVTLKQAEKPSNVDLRIEILDEGPHDQVQEFKVTGSSSSTQAQVLAFLDLQPECSYDLNQQRRLTEKLYSSGRFKEHRLKFERRGKGIGCLQIELVDAPGVPPLSEPLSPEATILLRARQWLSESELRGDDFVLEAESELVKLQLIQSRDGTLVEYDPSPQSDGANAAAADESQNADDLNANDLLGRTTFLVDSQRLCVGNSRSDSYWLADISEFGGWIKLETGFAASESDEYFGNITFSGNWSSERPPGELLFRQAFRLTPAGWCALAYKKNARSEVKDGVLTVQQGDQSLQVESETGRIVQFGAVGFSVSLKPGAFEKKRLAFLRELETRRSQYDAGKPVSSLISFFVSKSGLPILEGLQSGLEESQFSVDHSLCSALAKLAQADLFLPLDAFVIQSREWTRVERFAIPDQSTSQKDFRQMAVGAASKFLLGCLPKLFAEGTWPMAVSREACLVALDRGRYAGEVVQELQNDQTEAPLRDASVAFLLSMIGQPQANAFANRALLTMDHEAFDRDKQILLRGSFGQWIAGLVKAVGSLDEQERDALTKRMASERARATFLLLHAQAQADATNQRLWYEATHQSLEAKLREITGR
jgi:hypothetical protein